jgi:hypothetical protein
MKVISFSIFRAPCEHFEFMSYLRGLYFNARMNTLIYPDWETWIHVQEEVYNEYQNYFQRLPADLVRVMSESPLCESMLWRLNPIFEDNVTHTIFRDADALTSYREAQSVNLWIKSGKDAHVIHDNPSHSGLMGGMTGLKGDVIRNKFYSLNDLIKGWDLSKRGSDQDLLNKRILPLVNDSLYTADLQSFKTTTNPGKENPILHVDHRLWESNLCTSFIGSAGVNELETLRFFKRFDKTDYSDFEKEFSDICYWQR